MSDNFQVKVDPELWTKLDMDVERFMNVPPRVDERLSGMLERVGISGEVVFTGGVANNRFLVDILSAKIGRPITVPVHPEIVGAIGAALHKVKSA